MPESGTPATDPSEIGFGTVGSDVRSEPASESGSQVRPGDVRTDGQGEQSQQHSDDPESLAERLTRYAGYWNLEFGNEQGEGAASGGIPGAFGSINAGAWGQGVFLSLTVVDIGLTIITLGELAALKAAARQSISAMRKAGKFAKQAVNAAADRIGDATRAVIKYGDKAASVLSTTSRNASRAIRNMIERELGESLKGYDYFLHGTTRELAESFALLPGRELFTTLDPAVARLFAERTIAKLGGREIGGIAVVLPQEVTKHLVSTGQLIVRPISDMPNVLEWVFQPGARDTILRLGDILPLPPGAL
jgi:hypothetical protein